MPKEILLMRRWLTLLLLGFGCGGGAGPDLDTIRAQFQLVVPRDGGLGVHRRQEVRWRPFPGARDFAVEVYADERLALLHERREGVTGVTSRIETDLDPAREYWVVVVARSADGAELGRTPVSRLRVQEIPAWMPDFETPVLDLEASQGSYVLTNLIHRNRRTGSAERIPVMMLFNRWGELVWWYLHPEPGVLTSTKVTPRGTIYYQLRRVLEDGSVDSRGYEVEWDGTVLWESRPGVLVHHEISDMPDGRMYLTYEVETADGVDYEGDGIEIVDPDTNEVVWSWLIFDHYDPLDYNDIPEVANRGISRLGVDWTHANSVIWDGGRSLIWVSVRNLDRIIGIDYPSGEVRITIGQEGIGGDGLLGHQHALELQPDGSLLLWDNGNGKNPPFSRAVQLAFDAGAATVETRFEWVDDPSFFDPAVGDANRLPNGNTLITAGVSGRLIEVTPAGRIVWEKRFDDPDEYWHYRAERVPDELVPPEIRERSE